MVEDKRLEPFDMKLRHGTTAHRMRAQPLNLDNDLSNKPFPHIRRAFVRVMYLQVPKVLIADAANVIRAFSDMGLLQTKTFFCLGEGDIAAFFQVHQTLHDSLHKGALFSIFLIILE